jgi:hypothetical protein
VLADIARPAHHVRRPDLLNGVRHSLRIARALHERFPDLTFDCTTKVEHILEHECVWRTLPIKSCSATKSRTERMAHERVPLTQTVAVYLARHDPPLGSAGTTSTGAAPPSSASSAA